MEFAPEGPKAIPLWINGHAYLTMAPEFCDVRDSAHDRVLRRTPLCAADVADNALESARKASAEWRAQPEADRRALCLLLAVEVERYAEHFCRLFHRFQLRMAKHTLMLFSPIPPTPAPTRGPPIPAASCRSMHPRKRSAPRTH